MEDVVFWLAFIGSFLYLGEKLLSPFLKKGNTQRVSQLADEVRLLSSTLAEYQSKLRKMEAILPPPAKEESPSAAAPKGADNNDPHLGIKKDAEERAKACRGEAMRFAMAAVEASGREKSRLIAEAKALFKKAQEYQAVAAGEVFLSLEDSGSPEKSNGRKAAGRFEVVA